MALILEQSPALSELGKQRLLATEGKAFMLADWVRTVFMHFEIDPAVPPQVPFDLDLRDGKAYVSLVAFEMNRFRMRCGERFVRWLFRPVSDHRFLNVRTYVRYRGEPGIHFMTEWLNSRISVLLGGRTYGLPYRVGQLEYRHEHDRRQIDGCVRQPRIPGCVRWHATFPDEPVFEPCGAGSVTEFVTERYSAFTRWRNVYRLFRVWHEPWPMTRIDLTLDDLSLVHNAYPCLRQARFIAARYSPGVFDVWMGRPQCVNGRFCNRLWNEAEGRAER